MAKIELLAKFTQIALPNSHPLLKKVLHYAKKHFSQCHMLSSSLLILNDTECFKKNYLLNWVYHALECVHEKDISTHSLEEVLQKSHLPIRIKIINQNTLLEKIEVKVLTFGAEYALFITKHPIAKRFLRQKFSGYVFLETQDELHIRGDSERFWELIVTLNENRIVHNACLDFIYPNGFGKDSYTTLAERKLKECYKTLGFIKHENFSEVKKRYLELAKTYHPDLCDLKEKKALYAKRFAIIQEAYSHIKKHA
ncbi:J domain-containing protein [Helicobacter pylori]